MKSATAQRDKGRSRLCFHLIVVVFNTNTTKHPPTTRLIDTMVKLKQVEVGEDILSSALSQFRPCDVKPTPSWPSLKAFHLTPKARNTTFAKIGSKARGMFDAAKDDLGVIDAVQEGFLHMINHFHALEDEGFRILDVSLHPLQNDIEMETVKYLVHENGDGTKDVTYISRHVCELSWPQMMDVYWDKRLTMDTKARDYEAKVSLHGKE